MLKRLRIVVLLWFALAVSLTTSGEPVQAAVPTDFGEEDIVTLSAPTAMAFLPDGRILVTEKAGLLRVVKNGALLPAPALNLTATVCGNASERGLLGVAVHPQFATNGFIYLYYTHEDDQGNCSSNNPGPDAFPKPAYNRASRFKMVGDLVDAGTPEMPLVDHIPSYNTNHNGGDLHFGKDGHLYISVGDGGADYGGSGSGGGNDAARERHTLLGKILRVTDEGGIPADNPFLGADSDRCNATGRTDPVDVNKKCQETFAWGLRNPFRIAFDPNAAGTRFFINDVGQNDWEEVNEAAKGADYGWNQREGFCMYNTSTCRSVPGATVNGQTDPLYAYNGTSVTGGAFVPAGVWPPEYDGDYLFGEYGSTGTIMRMESNGSGGYTVSNFATNIGSVVELDFGPDGNGGQALYYLDYNTGKLRRIIYAGTINRAPNSVLTAQPTSGPLPLQVTFDGSGSNDPNSGDTLSYEWDFGDGSAPVTTTTPGTTHTYTEQGSFSASLRVRDNNGLADATPATVAISAGNTAPTATITAPAASERFRVGQAITLQGTGSDPEDSTPPALSWKVILHHNDHTHPFLEPTAGVSVTITMPSPEDIEATANSYLEVQLSATDTSGVSTVVTTTLLPKLVNLTFATVPENFTLTINGSSVTGGQTIVSWENYALNVSAPAQQDSAGHWLRLASWSDNGAPSHTITTPAAPATYTATFEPAHLAWLPIIGK